VRGTQTGHNYPRMHSRFLGVLCFAALLPSAFAALSQEELSNLPRSAIEARLPDEHPYSYFGYTGRLLNERDAGPALKWYYIAQLRAYFYLRAHPDLPADDEPDALSVLKMEFGEVLNQYGSEHPDIWIAAVKDALAWDWDHPNNFTSKETFKDIYSSARADVEKLERQIETNGSDCRLIAFGLNPMPKDWPPTRAISSAKDLVGIYEDSAAFGAGPVFANSFPIWPSSILAEKLLIFPLSEKRLLVIAMGRKGEVGRGEVDLVFSGGAAVFAAAGGDPSRAEAADKIQLQGNAEAGLVLCRNFGFKDQFGDHSRRQWLRARRTGEVTANTPVPAAPPDLTAQEAVAAADGSRSGQSGIFRFEMRNLHRRNGWLYLLSENDDQDPGCIAVALSPSDQPVLRLTVSSQLENAFRDHTIRVAGHVQRTDGRVEVRVFPPGAIKLVP
jgi:hypothetical protein